MVFVNLLLAIPMLEFKECCANEINFVLFNCNGFEFKFYGKYGRKKNRSGGTQKKLGGN